MSFGCLQRPTGYFSKMWVSISEICTFTFIVALFHAFITWTSLPNVHQQMEVACGIYITMAYYPAFKKKEII